MKKTLSLLIWLSLFSPLYGQIESVQIPDNFPESKTYTFFDDEQRINLSSSVFYLNDSQNIYDLHKILQPEVQLRFQRIEHESTLDFSPRGTHWFRLDLTGNRKLFQEYLLEYPKHYSRLKVYQIDGDTLRQFDVLGYDVESDSNHLRLSRFDSRIVFGPGEQKALLFQGIQPRSPLVADHFSFFLFPLSNKIQFNRWKIILITTIRVLALTVLFYHLLLYFRLERNRIYYLYFVILAIPSLTHGQLDIGVFHYIEEWLWAKDLVTVGPWSGIESVIFNSFILLAIRGLLDLPEFLPRMNWIFLLLIFLILLDPIIQMILGTTWSLPFFDINQPYRNLLFFAVIIVTLVAGWLRWHQGSKAGFFIFLGLCIMMFNTILQGFVFGENRPILGLLCSFFTLLTMLTLASLAVSERHREMEMDYNNNLLNRQLAVAEAHRLRELDEVKSKLYTNITHEFRTPLTVIQGLAENEIRKEGVLPSKKNLENAQLVLRNSQNVLNLVNRMLDLAKLESGNLSLKLVHGDILPFLRYITESFHSLASSQNIQLYFDTKEDTIDMDYDPKKTLQILSNLISNAIKFTLDYGKVTITVLKSIEESKQMLLLEVKDTGIGISPEHLTQIFDRFYQVDQGLNHYVEGTGIGLALTKELVQLMGGTIKVESELKQGSAFTVSIPIEHKTHRHPMENVTHSSENKILLSEISPAMPADSQSRYQPADESAYQLLIVEDNSDVAHYLTTCLQDEYQLSYASNGQQGIEKAIEKVPDIIISDVMMPVKDGFELCATLKKDERTSHIPIILLTARADMSSKIEGLEYGADVYLAKPFNRAELEVRLRKLIELRQKLQARYTHLDFTPGSPLSKEDGFVLKVKEVILENLEDASLGIEELCDALHLSRTHLHRKLKALTGLSTSHFIHQIRLHEAYHLLNKTDFNVSEVAYRVGYKDPGYFSKLFSKRYGKPPREI